MRHIINVGTDVASLCFFDSAALPADVDARLKQHYDKVGRELAQEGRVGWIDYDSDGGYVMHFYVDEAVPENILRHAAKPREIERLLVPSGLVWACGAEYLCQDPRRGPRTSGGLAKYPHMGASFQVPTGDYAATVWEIEWPEDAEEQTIDKSLTPADARLRRRLNFAMGYVIMAILGLGIALVVSALRHFARAGALPSWHVWGWPLLAALIAVAFTAGRKLHRLQSTFEHVTRDFPSFVVHLRRHAG